MRLTTARSFLALSLSLSLCLTLMMPSPARAWGAQGHRIVAAIAAEFLTPAARRAVAELLDDDSLASIANEADRIRNSRPETKNWHFVDIPLAANNFDPTRDCKESPKGDCVIAAIERSIATLKTSSSKEARREALMFMVHFVGDLHQPLHCADNDDQGGNAVKVTFFGKRSNLHSVWDSGIINQAGLSESEFIDELLEALDRMNDRRIAQIQSGSVKDWALEAHRLARTNSYQIPRNRKLEAAYYDRNFGVVDDQLMKAGLRLAKILNEISGEAGDESHHRRLALDH